MKEYNIKHDYTTKLSAQFDKNCWSGTDHLKKSIKKQQGIFTTNKKDSELVTKLNFKLCESLSVMENLLKIVWQYSQNMHAQGKNIWLSKLALPALLSYTGQMIFQIISVAERILYFCLAHYLIRPLGSTHIFTQSGWLILFYWTIFPGSTNWGSRQTLSLFSELLRSGQT